jgi:hypothetical protein
MSASESVIDARALLRVASRVLGVAARSVSARRNARELPSGAGIVGQIADHVTSQYKVNAGDTSAAKARKRPRDRS